jgi:hypothetical protein
MIWLSAGWLWLLVPWVLLAAWLWRKPARARGVTASFLWPAGLTRPGTFALRRSPPLWAWLLLACLLSGIVSLARPALPIQTTRVGVVIDPSVRLSATGQRDALIDRCEALARQCPWASFTYRLAGSADTLTADEARLARATARRTHGMVDAAIDVALEQNDVVIALTHQAVEHRSPRLAVFAAARARNASVEQVAVRSAASGSAAIWVSMVSEGVPEAIEVALRSGDASVRHTIHADSSVQRSIVASLQALGPTVEVELSAKDGFALDDRAVLVRGGAWPRLRVGANASAFVRRFAQVYAQTRPPDQNSVELLVGPDARASVVLADAFDTSATNNVSLIPHAALDDVSADDLAGRRVARAMPAGEWTVIARADGRPIIATREGSPRQVWLGVELGADAGTSVQDVAGVMLLSSAVEWARSGEAPAYHSATPDKVEPDWTPQRLLDPTVEASPGEYLDGTGRRVAVNLPAPVRAPAVDTGDAFEMLASHRRKSAKDASGVLSLLAAGLACMGAVAYGRASRAGIRNPTQSGRRKLSGPRSLP